MQQIEYIDIKKLKTSTFNPRKNIGFEELNELSESIAQVGMLSPIIARKKGKSFEIVCGERRYRAAILAKLETIPAVVRDLTDDEALDLMITENLQRKDVSPLEEAEAFKSLIEKRSYDIAGLVARFGKSETYIRHRLKLNDLIPDFRELLQKDIINLSLAVEICKLAAGTQKEVYDEDYSDRDKPWWQPNTAKEFRRKIEREYSMKLANAPFSPVDATLDRKAGACISCPKNSALNTILFPDMPVEGVCLDRSCFKHKSDIHFDRELKRVINEEPDVVIGHANYGDGKGTIQKLEKEGVPVVETSWSTGWRGTVEKPEPPEEPNLEDYDGLDDEDYKQELDWYKDALGEYEEDLKEYNEKIASGNLVKVFRIDGPRKGKYEYYELPEVKSGDPASQDRDQINTQQQVQKLEAKDQRNKEIAFEKTYADASELLDEQGYIKVDTELTNQEWQALFVIMMVAVEYHYPGLRKLLFGTTDRLNLNKNGKYFEVAASLSQEHMNRLMRSFIRKNIDVSNASYALSEAKSLIQIAKDFYPEKMAEIEGKHTAVYEKRKTSIERKIAELKPET